MFTVLRMEPETLQVPTVHGTMPVELTRPDAVAAAPLVVLFMDGPGVRPALRGHAARLSEAGFMVALLDLYYRLDPAQRPDIDGLASGDPTAMAGMLAAVSTLDDTDTLSDVEALREHLGATDTPWGCVGFCLGGRLALRAANAFAPTVKGASLLHPTNLVDDTPSSPHRHVDQIQGELYIAYGEIDAVAPPTDLPALQAALNHEGVHYRAQILPGADHGFMNPDAPSYQREAAELAWQDTIAMLTRTLHG